MSNCFLTVTTILCLFHVPFSCPNVCHQEKTSVHVLNKDYIATFDIIEASLDPFVVSKIQIVNQFV